MFLEVEPEAQDQPLEVTILKDRHNEQEISKLQRAFRHEARGLPTTHLKESLLVKRDITSCLEEKSKLDRILTNVLCKQHVQTYEDHVQYLQDHIECQSDLDEEIKLNKLYVAQLHSQLQRLDELELNLKRNSLTELQRSQKLRKAQRDYDTYNQRLNVSKIREGTLTKENHDLQSFIRHMLFERSIFHKNWDLLIQELGQNKRYLIDLIERSILAFTRDEDWYSKIDSLEQRAQVSKNGHVSEVLRLFRKLDADQIYQSFLGRKGFRRELLPLDEREVRRREMVEGCLKSNLREFRKIINKVKEPYGPPRKDKKTAPKSEKKTKIKDDSPKEPPETLEQKLLLLWTIIDQHKTDKEGYFAHFKYLNDVYNAIELLSSQIYDKHERIIGARENQTKHRFEYKKDHLSVYNELKNLKQVTTKRAKDWKSSETQLTNYLKNVHAMFQTLKCDTTFIESFLGDKMTVTNFNIKLFLSTLEATLNKILAYIYYSEMKAKVPVNRRTVKTKRTDVKIIPVQDTINTTQCSECAEREDVNRYDETIVLPSSTVAVKERVKQRVVANELEYRLHNLSKCRLPKSRILVNKRFM